MVEPSAESDIKFLWWVETGESVATVCQGNNRRINISHVSTALSQSDSQLHHQLTTPHHIIAIILLTLPTNKNKMERCDEVE